VAKSAQTAAILMGAETVSVTGVLSATQTRDLKRARACLTYVESHKDPLTLQTPRDLTSGNRDLLAAQAQTSKSDPRRGIIR